MRMSTIASAISVAGAAVALYAALKKLREEYEGEETNSLATAGGMRDAGPEAMANPPRRWETVDQQADESFPASDPPGNY